MTPGTESPVLFPKEFELKHLLSLIALIAFASLGQTQPAAVLPPSALIESAPAADVQAPDEKFDALKSCVSVWNANPGSDGRTYGGSGVCIASEDNQSIVVTNNHIFSERNHPDGGFYTDVYPLPAVVVSGKERLKATALYADRDADIAVVLVHGPLTPAKIGVPVKVGDKVWRNGNGSGYQTGRVIPAERPEMARFTLYTNSQSESGDSGSGYFNEQNELVGIHCGKDGAAARGTTVTHVKAVVKTKAPLRLFPRLRDRLESRRGTSVFLPEAPAAKVEAPKAQVSAPKEAPKELPKAAPTVTYYYLPAGLQGSSCSGGVCPVPQYSRPGLFRR